MNSEHVSPTFAGSLGDASYFWVVGEGLMAMHVAAGHTPASKESRPTAATALGPLTPSREGIGPSSSPGVTLLWTL